MATSLQRPLSSVSKEAVVERFNCKQSQELPGHRVTHLQGNQRQSWTLETLLWIPDFMN